MGIFFLTDQSFANFGRTENKLSMQLNMSCMYKENFRCFIRSKDLNVFKNNITRWCHTKQLCFAWGVLKSQIARLPPCLYFNVLRSGTYEIARGSSHCMWVFFYFLLFFLFCPFSLIFKSVKYIPFNFFDYSAIIKHKFCISSFFILAKVDLFQYICKLLELSLSPLS